VSTFFTYAVPGIADGAIYALCALGLVLTYKTAGVFNFAHGALAATSAYAFYQFREKNGLPWPVAFVLALLLVGVLGGLLLERIASLLSEAPTVTVVVATVGLLVMLQSLCTAIYGSAVISFDDFLPTSGVRIGKVMISGGDMIITAFALGSAFGLFYFFGRTRTGKAMTAVVDDPNLLSLQSTNPAAVRRFAWVLGSCFASLSGMLLAPKLGVSVNTLILLVIAAYGAAAVGRFENLPMTVAGGLVIGVLVAYLPNFTQKVDNIIFQLLPSNLPFMVLFATLLVVPAHKFTQRGARNARRFRPVRSFSRPVTVTGMALSVLALALVPAVVNTADMAQYASGLSYAIIFASLGLITYTSGQISLCHLGFAAIGATTCGHLLHSGAPWLLAVLVGGLVTIPAGAIVSIPAIRLSGIYIAVATFGFGVLLQQIFYPSWLMFGVLNRVPVPRPTILGIDLTSDTRYYYLALVMAVLSSALVLLVLRSRLGSLLRALSDSPDALDAHGANTVVTRVLVFVIAAFLAGVGGAVLAGVPQSASGSAGGTFDFTVSLAFVAVLGFSGRRPLLSPFLAAFLYQVVKIYPPFSDPTFIKYQGAIFGALALLVALAPGMNLGRLVGKRGYEREGTSSVPPRSAPEPHRIVQPVARRERALSLAAQPVGGGQA
jgi:branched-subunit amino acid ABC-type transport system permease component